MVRGLISSSLSFRFLVIVIAVIVIVAGVFQVRQMPVDFLPEFSPPYVEIQTEALGLSAKEVEQMITVPMEQDLLAGVAWLDVIRSESVPGLSSVLIYFEPGTDIYRARQMVAERIAQSAVGLPHVSKPPTMIQPLSSASRFMVVGLSSKKLSLIQISVLARWVIAPRLMGVPGVAHVAIWGNRDRQLQVQVDPARLKAQDVSLQQVIETTGNALWVSPLSYLEASSPGTGGFIDTPNQRLGIWHVLPISTPEELAQVPVEGSDGLRLEDVANVVEDHQPMIGDAIVNDTNNLLLVIQKLPEINTLDVTRGVEDALAALRPGMATVDFDATIFRPATFLETAINNLGKTFLIGALLLILLLCAFLYEWRAALISIITIPLSLIAALYVLYSRGATMNAMVLTGLVVALGVIFDDAIRDVEHILIRLREARAAEDPRPAREIILAASQEIRSSIFYAVLIAALVTLPVFFLVDLAGAMLQPLAVSYLLAMLASMVVALTVTPALSFILLADAPVARRASPLKGWLQRGYARVLPGFLQKPWTAYALIALLLAGAFASLPFIRQGPLLSNFQEPYLVIQVEGPPATSQPEMNRILTQMSKDLRAIPGIRNVGAVLGRAEFGDQTVGINSAQVLVGMDPWANYAATVAAVRDTVAPYTGVTSRVQTYTQQVLSQPHKYTSDQLAVRLFGEDQAVLTSTSEQLRDELAKINGVVDPYVVMPPEEPTVEIEVNLDAAQKYGIKPGDARRSAATLLSGILVGNLFEEQKVFDVVVWGVPDIRNELTDVQNLMIETPGGGTIRLSDVANVRMVSSPTVIRREAASPYLDTRFTVQGRSARAVMSDVQKLIQNFDFPLEYHAEVQDAYGAQQSVLQSIIIAGLIALLGIYLLLQSASGSWKLAALALLTLLASFSGGLLAMLITGSFSISALAGLAAVFAIAARSLVMQIHQYRGLAQAEGETDRAAQILQGAREQVGPVTLTILATALFLLPVVIFGSIPGLEILFPMVIVMLGGLITTAVTSLFVLPCLSMLSWASREPELVFPPVPAD